jgi:hypothetical protein
VVQTICFNISVGTPVDKDYTYLGHVAAGRKVGCILDLACPGSVPMEFGFGKRRGNLFDNYANIIFRKDAWHTVNIVCPRKTKTFRTDASLSFYRETYGS